MKTIGTSTSCLGKQPTPPLPPHLPWVTPCLSREPGPVLGWVQLRVDVGQKPVERSTTQSPLQLQAFCAVWLLSLGEEKHTAVRQRNLVVHQNLHGEGGIDVAEAGGLGQNEETKITILRGCRQGRGSCVRRRGFGQDRVGWIFLRDICGTSNMVGDVTPSPQALTSLSTKTTRSMLDDLS